MAFSKTKKNRIEIPSLGQLLRSDVEPVHHFGHCSYRLQHVVVGGVSGLGLEDDEDSGLLVQDSLELLVKDHLRELLFNLGLRQVDLFSYVSHLQSRGNRSFIRLRRKIKVVLFAWFQQKYR